MKYAKIARRNALRAMAGVGVALPLLQTFRGFGTAEAQPTNYPKRLIIYATVHTGWPEQFWPLLAGQSARPQTPPANEYVTGLDALDVTDFSFSPILKPLEKHKSRLLITEGIDGFDGNHQGYSNYFGGRPSNFENVGGGVTVDHVLAKDLNLASVTKFANLQFGVKANSIDSGMGARLSWYGPEMPAAPESNPAKAYERIFADFKPPNATAPAAGPDPVLARRQSVLDASAKQLMDLQTRLPFKEDRDKLEQHLDSIRMVEQLVGKGSGSGALQACGKPTIPAGLDEFSEADAPAIAQAQIENMVLAMSCDLTRIATYQFYDDMGSFGHPWLGITKQHHNDLGHAPSEDADSQQQILKIETWQSGQVASLLDRLASMPEGAGTMLDNTLVVFVQTATRGNYHGNTNSPLVLAGNLAGNVIRTGRYMRFKRTASQGSRPVGGGGEALSNLGFARTSSDLCLTLLKAFGSNATTFGDPARLTGGIHEILA